MIPPNAVPVNTTGCPTPKFSVLKQVIRFCPLVVAVHSIVNVAIDNPEAVVNVGEVATVNTV